MVIFGIFFFKEKLNSQFILSVLAAFTGVVLLIGFGSIGKFEDMYLKGILFGLLTGVFLWFVPNSVKKIGSFQKSSSFFFRLWRGYLYSPLSF